MKAKKILGIDYGERRIGLAIADNLLRLALPKGCVECKNLHIAVRKIETLCKEWEIGEIVIGLPLELSGKESELQKKTKNFILELKKKISIPIKWQDERLTTKAAQKLLKGQKERKERIDALCAQIILQTHLDQKK
ncbi:Holliday junction resolvase RuvX [Candidatus Peregrinibacteria bacterium]|nr:Holliday junction resolvase RuvX [Candidatus Peregrinibacteria bacterium]